ncbi:hypothetical protein [Paenibacillus harenae]|uniref:hypothetical protein n=1 Tax=Paenibacillus harenae TaxID=306543 RepID=UPI00048C18A9|nr:hypothetical protein [Paenibacillus harenae]
MDKPTIQPPPQRNIPEEKSVKIIYLNGGSHEFKSDKAAEIIRAGFDSGKLNGSTLLALPYYGRNLIVNMMNVRSIEIG